MTTKSNKFHASLHVLDTEKQTYGCRHTNSSICGKNLLPEICAFVRSDNICLAPPRSWGKQFNKLKSQEIGKEDNILSD